MKKSLISNSVKRYIFLGIFIVVGILFILFGAGVFTNTTGWIKIDSTITQIDQATTSTFVSYVVNGVKYTNARLGEYSSSYRVGQIIPILYNPANPNEIVSASTLSKLGPIIVGGVFTGAGVILTISAIIKDVRHKTCFEKKEEPEFTKTFGIEEEPITFNVESKRKVHTKLEAEEEIILSKYTFNKSNEKKCKNDFIVMDEKSTLAYKIHLEDSSLFKGDLYSFSNLLTHNTLLHRVGRSFATDGFYDNPLGEHLRKTYFKIDKEPCWDYLASRQLEIMLTMKDNKQAYKISRKGDAMGTIISNIENPYTDNPIEMIKNFKNKTSLTIECEDKYIEDVVLVAFTLAFLSKCPESGGY